MDRPAPTTISAPHHEEIVRRDRAPAAWTLPEKLARAGAMWAVLFAVAHFYWAGGGRLGTTRNAGPIGERPVFLAYDLAAGLVFLAAAAAAAVLISGRLDPRLQSRLLTATIWAAAIALVRGAGGLVQDVILVATGRGVGVGVSYDVWFAVAGVVFLVAGQGLRRQRGAARRTPASTAVH